MPKFTVGINRIGYSHLDFEVEADNEDDARSKALGKSGDHVYSEHDAAYEVDYVEEEKNA